MGQIILNYLGIFIIPLLVGALVRFLCRRARRPYLVTLCLAALMAAAWFAARTLPANGSEGNALRAVQLSCAAAASLATGIVLALGRRTGSG